MNIYNELDECVVCGEHFANAHQPSCEHSETNQVKINTQCVQCGDDSDLMVAFTKHQVCGKCTRKNYKQVVKGR